MNYSTETFLLRDLQSNDIERSWCYFYEKYAPLITRFATRKGVSQADTCDILQETMLELYTTLPRFKYDPSRGKFRNFVLLITSRRCCRYFQRKNKQPYPTDPSKFESPTGWDRDSVVSCGEKLSAEPAFQFELVSLALESLKQQKRITESSYFAYQKYAINNEQARSVAKDMRMTIGQLYRVKNRINKMIQEEIVSSDNQDSEILESVQF